ncbi:hypothetical protein PCL_07859 [Purpureocillium lilacinum]|uniref:Uncharacterized protein n=1 Tax=Purpureocillium lilacinum TaxID=33203 RepID=A0A2U3EJ38_PURLI|nr:hypothetical protein PCL_07859 [Purpureocillium lilacinum]
MLQPSSDRLATPVSREDPGRHPKRHPAVSTLPNRAASPAARIMSLRNVDHGGTLARLVSPQQTTTEGGVIALPRAA